MEKLLALAGEQYGVFSRAQAHEQSITDKMLRHRLRIGLFERRSPTVFAIVGAPRTWLQDVMAACLGANTLCVAAKRTAAYLHQVERFQPKSIEVLVEHPARYRRDGIIVHSTRDLPDCDITYVGPIPVTSADRTLIDLGAVAPLRRVEHATDAAEREQLIRPEALAARHRKLRRQGRNGIAIMTEVLADRGPVVPQSTLERDFVRLVADAHLPRPELQHPVDVAYGRVYIDAAYPDRMKGFEVDGHQWHASRSQRASDNRRLRALADVGWDIRRFTYEEVKRNGPAVVRSVRIALGLPFGDNP